MAEQERNASAGYIAIKKQTDATTAVTPDKYTPYYKQSMATNINMVEDTPVYGSKFKFYQALQGLRSHGGSVTVMAEPDTAAYWFDMLLTRSGTSGSNPYTHVYGLSGTTDPNFYTMDISLVSQVVRFIGVGASKITPVFQDDEMQFEIELSAIGSFYGREIASVSTNTLTLKTSYDPSPTTGLVVNDLVQIQKADGSVVNTTVSSLTSTTVTVASAGSGVADGDMLVLRPATPSLSLKTPFLWPRTEFRFGADASAALSATQTRLDRGTEISIEHMFEDNEGSARSGGFDPASLVRTVGSYSFKIKKFFDKAGTIKEWNALTKRACVMRSFSETGYEFRVTMNNIKAKTNDMPTESESVIYHEVEYAALYDGGDGQGMSVTIIDSVSSV